MLASKRLPLPMKRLSDFVFPALRDLVLAPVLTVVAVLVRQRLGSPVLFKQTRPGLYGRPFTLYKFRTMTSVCDSGNLPPDARRRCQRRSRCDEAGNQPTYSALAGC